MEFIESKDQFFALQAQNFDKIPYAQARSWYAYVEKLKKKIVFLIDSSENTRIMCWAVENKIPILGKKTLQIHSECYNENIKESEIKIFYESILQLGYAGVEIISDSYYNINFEIGLKLAGYQRPLASFSSNLSIEIDLQTGIKYDNNWKGNIRKGEKSGLITNEICDFDENSLTELIKIFDEMSNENGLPKHDEIALRAILLSDDVRVFSVYNDVESLLAVNVIQVNKPYATFIYAANSSKLKMNYGSHFLVDFVIRKLKSENFKLFDLCRIPVGNIIL